VSARSPIEGERDPHEIPADYRALFDNMAEGFAYCQMLYDEQDRPIDWVYLAVNNSFADLTNLVDVVGKKISEILPTTIEETPELLEIYGRVASTGRPEKFEIDFTPLGKWLEVTAFCPERGRFAAVFEDITARKRVEQSLRLAQISVDSAEEAVLWVGPDGRLMYINDSLAARLGYTRKELLAMNIWDVDGVITKESWPAKWQELKAAKALVFESLKRTKDGEVFPVEVYATHVHDGDQEHGLILVREITERMHAEEALRQSMELFSKAFHANPGGVALSRLSDGQLIDVNEGFTSMFGYTESELVGHTTAELGILPDAELRDTLVKEMSEAGKIRDREIVARHKSGELRHLLLSVEPVEMGGQACILSFLTDITERVRSEQAFKDQEELLRQAQKMEAVGQLAGGIAHDFNNVLTAIIGYSDLILSSPGSSTAGVQDDVKEIKKAAERAGSLTRQILAFSRKQALRPELVSLNRVLPNMERLLSRTLGEHIELVTLLKPDLGLVEIDVSQLEQVLVNLATNARDAMPEGGILTIETANIELGPEYSRMHPEIEPGPHVMLTVTDTGIGMDENVRSRIFEPFFTTKPPGLGTGLGLATVYGIIRQSGGNIYVYSEPGQGSTFRIYLPRVDKPVAPPRASAGDQPMSLRGHESILVLEDEGSVRTLVTRILAGHGYAVSPASSGREALEMLEDMDRHFDLLLSDLVLSGELQGHQVARQAEILRPGLPVLFMSGYTRDSIVHAGRLDGGVNYLEKPFTPEALARRVRELLDDRDAPPEDGMSSASERPRGHGVPDASDAPDSNA